MGRPPLTEPVPERESEALQRVLAQAQRIGLVGPGPVAGAIDHAGRFVDAVPRGTDQSVDLGSGGGLPGLVIAVRRPEIHVVLVDRRERACDFLRRAATALMISGRVDVIQAEALTVARDRRFRGLVEVVTSRGFGAPAQVAEVALPLLRPGGRLIVSVASSGERWPEDGLARLDAHVLSRHDGLLVIGAGHCPEIYPRRRGTPVW